MEDEVKDVVNLGVEDSIDKAAIDGEPEIVEENEVNVRVNAKELLDEVTKEISDLFKERAQKAKEDLSYWAQKLFELRAIQLAGTEEQIEEAKKSEKYAMNALQSLYAIEVNVINEQAWNFIEKLLIVLKRVILFV